MSEQQQYDASGFDDDIESIAEVAKAADAGSLGHHPEGKFQGTIFDVVRKDYQERPLWEIKVETPHGETKATLFGFKPGEVRAAKAKAAHGNKDDLDRIQAGIARAKRLFVDVGLPEPLTWVDGDNSVVGRLGELIDKRCTVVVAKDRQKPDRQRTFINAPSDKPAERHIGDALDQHYQGAPTPDLPDFTNPASGLDQVPF